MEETAPSEYRGSSHASSMTDPTSNTVEHCIGIEKDAELTDQSSLFTAYHEEDRVRVITDDDYEDCESKEDNPATHRNVNELVAALGRGGGNDMSEFPPELERRVRDFRLAQQKRREKYGEQKRWGIFGMYAHLASVRVDLEWAEDAAWRRNNDKPYLSWGDFDDARRQRQMRPWFTYSVIFICSIMMIVEFGLNDWKVESLKNNPLIGPSAEALIRAGARETTRIVEKGQWFRIFSPLILHAGIIHYVINMAAWFFIGAAVEQSHGLKNAIILFLIPGVGGNILSAIFLPQYISVGASGGIFGLIGGCLADITLNWKLLFIRESEDDDKTFRTNVAAIAWLVFDIVINVLLGLTPFIDNFTHVGEYFVFVCLFLVVAAIWLTFILVTEQEALFMACAAGGLLWNRLRSAFLASRKSPIPSCVRDSCASLDLFSLL